MIKHEWRIVRGAKPRQWDIQTRVFVISASGQVTMGQDWTRHSVATSKRAALARIMVLRDRGEKVSWEGGPMRLGIALMESCS
jgi:hypothetical protein